MNEQRLVVAIFGVVVAGVAGYLVSQFIAALTVSVFLYYSTRGFYQKLGRFWMPKQLRAMVTISLLAVPLVVILSYTILLLVLEARQFLETYPVADSMPETAGWFEGIEEMPELTVNGLIGAYQAGQFDVLIQFGVDHAAFVTSLVTGLLLNLLIVAVVTYYLLIDGSRFHEWLLRFDEDDLAREFFEAADEELEVVLFGNLLNVILISLVAIVVFSGYNTIAPPQASVPYPALAGALTGIASLIPVVGMKIVYVPVAIIAAVPAVLSGDYSLLGYVGGFLLLAIVIVDTIPDLVLRPYLSGNRTHVGLLMLAYIFGPVVFGFYGLFFAPIILVLGLTFADTALPRLLGADPPTETQPPNQRRLDEF